MSTQTWIIKGIEWTVGFLRFIHAHRLVWTIRERTTLGVLRRLHLQLVHRMRRLALQMATNWDKEHDVATQLALEICTDCRKMMGTFLELPENKLHCCFKMLAPRAGPDDEERVATWVRSEPRDARPIEQGDQNAHRVGTNSVWCALFGRSDGVTHWAGFSCFSCNDLTKRGALFRCDRENWANYYRSTLVFPIRHANNVQGTDFQLLGFIAFDSPDAGAFRGLPDIFEYRDDLTGYQDLLNGLAAFHLGAVVADTLGTLLGMAYARHNPTERRAS